MADINRIVWMVLFLLGVVVFAWITWQDGSSSQMAWFILTSLWSAVCAIGYSILHWFIVDRKTESNTNRYQE